MDKYQKLIFALIIVIVLSSTFYSMLTILGFMVSSFPFYIFFPGFMVILIPIIARKRLDELNKKEQLKNYLEE